MSFFGFGQTADIEIVFDDADKRKVAEVKTDEGKKEKLLLYYDGETVSGRVNVTLRKPGSKLEHQGIKVELIGQIELFYDRGNHHEFISLVKELARPGDLLQHTSYPFEFANVEKPYEVYSGANVRLRYFLRATIVRRLTDVIKEVDIAVHTLCSYPDVLNSIKMEVGIEDCLHIEFEYNKSKYHLKDVIVGKIYFLLVRIKIKHMEISIIKRETTGSSPNTFTENETVAKYEIMDGAPVKGESIPIRVFLAGYDLTPTMRDINNKFSVRYYLNLVLMDTEDRRYFKQQEVILWRKSDKNRLALHNPHHPQNLTSGIPQRQLSASSEENSTRGLSPTKPESALQRSISPAMPKIEAYNGPSEMEQEEPDILPPKLANTHIQHNEPEKPDIANDKPVERPKVAEKPLDKPQLEEPVLEIVPEKPQVSEKPPVAVKPAVEKPIKEKIAVAEKPLLAEKPQAAEKPFIAEKPVLSRPESVEATPSQ
ncbi:vacuolar protein sorting-associated protein 26B-like [Pararge aegeria]|uniref:Vacuolar protein sorting-associated protein 26 n=3 Tax=Pararge aegeria TaxID=116150 RepID=A0A8S4RPP0_9NEOP|nr:vacuolar protein sorting-associated protein 26B-like [Pararge aegeria]CAH2239722.1 jg6791 [Pararge aegeria aegeria]